MAMVTLSCAGPRSDLEIQESQGQHDGRAVLSVLICAAFWRAGIARELRPGRAVRSLAVAAIALEGKAQPAGIEPQPGLLEAALQRPGVALQEVERLRPVGRDQGAHP